MVGETFAHYTIECLLGAGRMGQVYKARDTRLGRDVAIKVLPESFARDPERMARIEREARTLASLNHPNIAAIHGLEVWPLWLVYAHWSFTTGRGCIEVSN